MPFVTPQSLLLFVLIPIVTYAVGDEKNKAFKMKCIHYTRDYSCIHSMNLYVCLCRSHVLFHDIDNCRQSMEHLQTTNYNVYLMYMNRLHVRVYYLSFYCFAPW